MPVEFLTDEQAARYGRFVEGPSRADLDRLCFLDDADRRLVASRRGDVSRLGFALQLVTVRSLGTFLADPLDVPTAVLDFVAEQLGIEDPSSVKGYVERRTTRFEHAAEIARERGYREFSIVEAELRGWVRDLAWTTGDGPRLIFDAAVGWLRERLVVLPGVSTLTRLVAAAVPSDRLRHHRRSRDDPRIAAQSVLTRLSTIVGDAGRAAEHRAVRRVGQLVGRAQGCPQLGAGRAAIRAAHRVRAGHGEGAASGVR